MTALLSLRAVFAAWWPALAVALGLLAGSASGCGSIGLPRTIYLARHGQTEWNRVSRMQGDPDLDAVGYLNRISLWKLLKERPLREIHTSALQRTRRTAELVAREQGLEIRSWPELNEITAGIFEGVCYAHILPESALHAGADRCPVPARGSRPEVLLPELRPLAGALLSESLTARLPQGESYQDLLARTAPFVTFLQRRARQSEVLIVGHGVTNRILLHRLVGWSLPQVGRLRQENDQVYRIEDAGTDRVRVSLYTPGTGWRRCSPPTPGQRQLDCSPAAAPTTGRAAATPAAAASSSP